MLTGQYFSKKRVLILDDDSAILEILIEYLNGVDFHVEAVEKTTDLFKIVDDFKPNLIILDCLLDGINGGELCHQLKNTDRTRHIPVILYSAYPRVLLSLGTYGCDLFIPKPFDLAHISKKIKQLLLINTPKPLSNTFRLQLK